MEKKAIREAKEVEAAKRALMAPPSVANIPSPRSQSKPSTFRPSNPPLATALPLVPPDPRDHYEYFITKIAGVTHRNPDHTSRQKLIRDNADTLLRPGSSLRITNDPDNKYDANAVRVCLPDMRMLGYLPEHVANRSRPPWGTISDMIVKIPIGASVVRVIGGEGYDESGEKMRFGVAISIFWFPHRSLDETRPLPRIVIKDEPE